MLQLIRKPDRDWNQPWKLCFARLNEGYNSLENPIGIETFGIFVSPFARFSYNSLENPIGIETRWWWDLPCRRRELQLIRKPDRDWNSTQSLHIQTWGLPLQLIRKPDRDWNKDEVLPIDEVVDPRYNSLENPIGIETRNHDGPQRHDD